MAVARVQLTNVVVLNWDAVQWTAFGNVATAVLVYVGFPTANTVFVT